MATAALPQENSLGQISEVSAADRPKAGSSPIPRGLRRGLALGCILLSSAVSGCVGDDVSQDVARVICMTPSVDSLAEDIDSGEVTHVMRGKDQTDDTEKFDVFLESAMTTLDTILKPENHKKLYVAFSVYFDAAKNPYKEIASAIVCTKELASLGSECRNRTYLTFSRQAPDRLGELIARDIVKLESEIRRCPRDA
jgi:hypothetical protein